MATQRSILEYLTERNPDIDNRQPANKRNTTRADYFIPKQLIEWTEFRFETLQMVYGGQLMKSAREKGVTLPDYPFLVPDVDCVVNCEPATVHILTKWNHGIVTAALNAVRDTFHPCRLAQDSTSDKALKAQLLDDGLIEYVSIPWGNNSGGNPEEYNNMTVNLGLWFIHVLAGNHHRVQWDYPALEKETLLTEPHVATLEPVTPTKKYSTESPPRRKKRLRVFDRCSSPAKRRRTSFSPSDHDSSSESSTGSTEQSSASDTEP
ncbi:hypothetical protein E8E14_011761 [Neopestalotiopsis sp. 37M]|nr:hypothetical protein E8E14_011761 [Neopestalotiopsis sp. 37M]